MIKREAKIGLVVFLSIVAIGGLLWLGLGNQRAALAKGYLDQGRDWEKTDQLKQAYFQYKKAQIATPRSFAPYYHQGLLLRKINQDEKAIKALESSIRFSQAELAPVFALAKIYYEQKNYGEAERYFQNCLTIEPNNGKLSFWLGRSQMNQNRLAEARESFQTALELLPTPRYHLYLGLTLAFQDLNSARQELEKYYQDQNLSFSELQNSSVQGVQTKDNQNLTKAFERMIKTESPATKKLILGQLLNQVGESGLATHKLEELTKEYPQMRDGWVFLGYSYISENRIDEAIGTLEKAVEIDPTNGQTFQLLGQAYKAKGEESTAREMLLKAQMLERE
jgi:tetratricopeptide (TPR) repeat protein